jgi:hypothetical protein
MIKLAIESILLLLVGGASTALFCYLLWLIDEQFARARRRRRFAALERYWDSLDRTRRSSRGNA